MVSSVPEHAGVMDSIDPLGPSVEVQVLGSSERLVLRRSSAGEPCAPSGMAAMVMPTHSCSSELHLPVGEPAGSNGVAGPSGMANTVMPAHSSPEEDDDELHVGGIPGSTGRRVNPYSSELKSMWNWRKMFTRLGTVEDCIQFAEDRELLPREKYCTYHKRKMSLTRKTGEIGKFRCRKSKCRAKSESRAIGTLFENSKISFTVIFEIMYAFSEGLSYYQTRKQLASEDGTVLSTRTVADWFGYCRDAISMYELENEEERERIGGPGKIVLIDKSKCGKSKFNTKHNIEGNWVIGIIEDKSDDLRLEVCPDNEKSADILVPLIKKHVREGSTIHTEYWPAIMGLSEHGYIHKWVNNVAPDGAHTQRIENEWRGLKQAFLKQQNKEDFTEWLCEYTWRRRIRLHHLDPFQKLLKAVRHRYGNK